MKTISALFGLCLSVIFVSTSLSASPEAMLIGKWKYFEGKKIEFIKDGTLIIGDQGAKYRIIDKERVEFDVGMLAGILSHFGPRPVFRFTISNDELTLTPIAEPEKAQKLRKVKTDASGNDAETYFDIGAKNIRQGKYQQAIKDFEKAIELDPKDPKVYFFRGGAYFKLGNYGQTLKDCDKAIELDPKDPKAYGGRADAYRKLGNYEQAIKNLEKVIELDPKSHAFAYYNIACCYSLQNNAAMACQWLKKAFEKGYKDFDQLKNDKDFDNVRNTPCYKELTKSK